MIQNSKTSFLKWHLIHLTMLMMTQVLYSQTTQTYNQNPKNETSLSHDETNLDTTGTYLENQKLEKEKKERIAEQERKQNLIKKYGKYWGKLIYNKEFTIGMTKEMVMEFTPKEFYLKSKALRNGNKIETWTMNRQYLQVASFGLLNIVPGWQAAFPTLVFKNGKIIEIIHSQY